MITNPAGPSPFLLLGDHAGRRIPQTLCDLGLKAGDLDLHIALDIGVEGLGLALAQRLDATFIRQAYSRLVIDCNRTPGSAGSILAVSDGVPIPGNQTVSPGGGRARETEIFQPYHDAIAAELDRRAAAGRKTTIIFLHSFTPVMRGVLRPWRFGVLHGSDSAFAFGVLAGLRARWADGVGDNEPYVLDDTDYGANHHARNRALGYVELEVRQDTIATAGDQRAVAALLAGIFTAAAATL